MKFPWITRTREAWEIICTLGILVAIMKIFATLVIIIDALVTAESVFTKLTRAITRMSAFFRFFTATFTTGF